MLVDAKLVLPNEDTLMSTLRLHHHRQTSKPHRMSCHVLKDRGKDMKYKQIKINSRRVLLSLCTT